MSSSGVFGASPKMRHEAHSAAMQVPTTVDDMSGDDPQVTGKGLPRTTTMNDGARVFLRHNWKGDWFTLMDGTTPYTPRQELWEHQVEPEDTTRIIFAPPK